MTAAILFPAHPADPENAPLPRPSYVHISSPDLIEATLYGRSQTLHTDTWTAHTCARQSELIDDAAVNAEATVFLARTLPEARAVVLGPMILTGPDGGDVPAALAHQVLTLDRPAHDPAAELAAAWTPNTFHRVIEHITLRESLALTNALPAVLPPIPSPLPH
ncbi:hypothetical protein [Micrococcus luteus]|uniref:hypothetical protein n=1 Tax=Micrococcus luteus TaxID=1270 RepID=UPI0010AEA2F4|nr:hypothetical protein [Micrococcus luteus]TKD49680.1 hypothetical protein FBF74_11740 [Micrococcus luteus]